MINYETVFILTPVLSEKQVEEAVTKFKDFLKKNSSKVVAEENWGLKKLAYSIQHKRNGFYQLIQFDSDDAEVVSKLELEMKRDERVLRFLTVKLDKHALAWADERRARMKGQSAPKKNEEKEEVTS